MIARRVRSWMSRSSDAGFAGAGLTGAFLGAVAGVPARAALLLAAMFPRDDEAENDVQAAEAGGQPEITESPDERCRGTERHQCHAERGQQRDARRRPGEDAGAVEQQPDRG